jgi:hypothetical protein
MAEEKKSFNQLIIEAARGNKATAISKAFFGSMKEKNESEKKEQ